MSGVKFGAATNGTLLSDFYNDEVRPRLTADLVYDWPGHDWHRSYRKWRGKCPHHTSESGTSFNVSLDTLAWFCPACDVGGGPVQYLYWRQGGSGSPRGPEFIEIVRGLAERVGLTLPERELTDDERKAAEAAAAKRGALELVYRVSQDHLWSDAGEGARAYLHGRGIDDDGIRSLELGLYPAFRDIRSALTAAGYQPAVDTGAWARMAGYVTFPWRDAYGQPLTLYGRWPGASGWPDGCEKTMALPGEGSKASPLYFDRLRRAHHTDATLVEGLLDAAVAQANGLTNVIAYVGAQPSYAQHRVLARQRIKTATICSDPDQGGEAGILSFLRNVDPAIRAYVAPKLPDGMDPDQFILAHGIDGWREHIARSEPGHTWQTRYILGQHDLRTSKGRDDARVELTEYARTAQEHEQDDIANLAAEPLQMEAGTLRRYLSGDDRRNGHAATPRADGPAQDQPELLDEVPPFPLETLPAAFRDLVVEAAAALPCPPDFIAVPLLVGAGSAIGDARELELKPGWREGPNLYAAIVGDPGSKKTPAQDKAARPLYRIQKRLARDFEDELSAYKAELAAWEGKKKSERGPKPEPPSFRHLVTTDATTEALAPMLLHSKGVAVLKDELTGWVRSMDQYRSGGKGADRQHFLSMWSRSLIKVDRKSNPAPIVVPRPVLAVVGGIQPDLLPELADAAQREDGFLDRLLWAYPDPVPDHWTTHGTSLETVQRVERIFEDLYALEGGTDDDGDPTPRIVHLSADASVLWAEWYAEHAAEMSAEDFPQRLRGPWAKMPGQLARLALILHATNGSREVDQLGQESLLAAADLVDYFKAHARRVYRHLARQRRDRVLALLQALRERGPLNQRSILHDVFNRNIPADRVLAMLQELEEAGLARRDQRTDTGGRPATVWSAT